MSAPPSFQEYPKWLYHPRLAPEGKIFQTAADTVGLAEKGWVETPAKFPKRSARSLAELKEDYDATEDEHHIWVAGGKCVPHSEKWEQVTARYQAARDAYEFALRNAQIAPPQPTPAPSSTKKSPLIFETALSKFTVEATIGEGGTGNVYRVQDEDGAIWAVKCLRPAVVSRDRRKRFRNEIAFCSTDRHPHIIRVEESGVAEIAGTRVPFYVMPAYASTLRQLMVDGIPHNQGLVLFDQVLSGLQVAHDAGVWHRDLKPENILYDATSKKLVVADFGIAHFAEELLHTTIQTADGDRLANFQYAAPEQRAYRQVDHRADIYALGVILNEMFTREILQGTGPRTIASVAPAFGYLDAVVERMVRQSPDDRPQSIAEVRAALNIPELSESVAATGSPKPSAPRPTVQQPDKDGSSPIKMTPDDLTSRDADDVFDRLRLHIFLGADARKPEAAHFNEYQMANDFGVDVVYIQEYFVDLHNEKLVSIAKWYENRNRPLNEWSSPQEFFEYRDDGGYIRTTLLRRGKQQLEQLKKGGLGNH
jgi:serine/threonine protein kinase